MKKFLALGLVTLALTATNAMNQTQTIILKADYNQGSQWASLTNFPVRHPITAQTAQALSNFDYNFDALVINQTIFGQDKWVNLLGGGGVSVRQGLGGNQTQTAKGDGGNPGTGARRPLDQAFYYTAKDTNVVWRVWGYVPSGGNNVTAIGGLSPIYFGPHQLGGITKLTTFLQQKSGYVTGDELHHDRWYEYQVVVNFSVSGGSASLSYREVTSPPTAFKNDQTIKDVNLGLVPDSLGRYGFSEVIIRNDGAGYVDNLHFDAPAPRAACVPPPSGLVSWWPGDGNANDIKNGNNGTLSNGATFSAGKVAQALSFDGVDDYVELGQPANLRPSNTDFTVVGWILVPDYPNNSPESRCSSYYPVIGFDWGWNIRVTGEGRVSFGKWTALQTAVSVLSTSPISTNTFHHFAAVHTVSELRIYVDGVLAGTQASSTGTIFYYGGPDTLQIGQVHCGVGKWNGKGLIDELAFYNRALTASEIQGIFNADSAGNCKTVVSPNKPPLANAGPDQTVEATSPSGASVTLNASGSSDPDSNPLTYNWTGPFGTASTVSPTVTLPLGTHTVTLKVSDGQATATDTVNITVRDITPPDTIMNSSVDGNGAAVVSGGSTLSGSITLSFGGTDAVGVAGFQCSRDGSVFAPCTSPAGYSALAIGSHTFQVRAVDAAGNVDASPGSFTWIVITPAQAIQNLITTVNNMGLAGGVANSLTAPLGQASTLLNDNNTSNDTSACGKLNAFLNQVNTKVQNGQLTSTEGSHLLQMANAIKAGLGC